AVGPVAANCNFDLKYSLWLKDFISPSFSTLQMRYSWESASRATLLNATNTAGFVCTSKPPNVKFPMLILARFKSVGLSLTNPGGLIHPSSSLGSSIGAGPLKRSHPAANKEKKILASTTMEFVLIISPHDFSRNDLLNYFNINTQRSVTFGSNGEPWIWIRN